MSDFYPGQHVLCVDASGGFTHTERLRKGEIYTIRSFFISLGGKPAVRLNEVANGYHPDGSEYGYYARRFRPLKDSALDVFRAHLAPAPKQKESAQ